MQTMNPYYTCPVYESEHFRFRLVDDSDAPDLLECYSDPLSAPFFNSDNCTSNFVYQSLAEMQNCVRFWLEEYRGGGYVRFSVVDLTRGKAVGTLECFAKPGTFPDLGKVGMLRVDLASGYENEADIREILAVVADHFYELFGVQSMITKAVPAAEARVRALKGSGYTELKNPEVTRFADYFVRTRFSA